MKQDTIQTDKIEQIVNEEHAEAGPEVEEYSYHDDASHSEHEAVPEQTPKAKKSSPVKGATGKEDSDEYEEDYEFWNNKIVQLKLRIIYRFKYKFTH